MPLYEPTIPYRYVEPLIQILKERGMAGIEDVLASTGLDAKTLKPADSSMPMARYDRLITTASAELDRDDLGFDTGLRISIESHSPVGVALGRCSTLEEIMFLLERYYHLVTPAFAVRYVPGPTHGEWRIRVAAPMSHTTLAMCLEMQAVSVHSDLKRLFGADAIFDIYLSTPEPKHKARFDSLPYTRFHFGAESLPEVRCIIPVELLRRRLSTSPVKARPDNASVDGGSPSGLQVVEHYGDWVALMLREAQAVQPSVAQLAALLSMSARTLARRLKSEGINFRDLSTRIRHSRACEMLEDPEMPLPQIAYQLGYADTTAFMRAFRRLEGMTPSLYREQFR